MAAVEGARAAGYVALKSIIAYRASLAIRETPQAEATDAYSIPEIFWIAARWGRWGLGKVLEDLMAAGALDEAEALSAARQILGANAARVYQVEL